MARNKKGAINSAFFVSLNIISVYIVAIKDDFICWLNKSNDS